MEYILITGAYGGMGSAAAQLLAGQGYGIFALDRQVGAPEENIIPIEADVTDEESIASAARQVHEVTDRLFAVIHFAGIYMLDSLAEMDSADFRRIFDINVQGGFSCKQSLYTVSRQRQSHYYNDERAGAARSASLHRHLCRDKSGARQICVFAADGAAASRYHCLGHPRWRGENGNARHFHRCARPLLSKDPTVPLQFQAVSPHR